MTQSNGSQDSRVVEPQDVLERLAKSERLLTAKELATPLCQHD